MNYGDKLKDITSNDHNATALTSLPAIRVSTTVMHGLRGTNHKGNRWYRSLRQPHPAQQIAVARVGTHRTPERITLEEHYAGRV
jgi:hypothetical protein